MEDVEINRFILMNLLEETGVAIDEAEDGQKALDIFRAAPEGTYDLIYMDVPMPHLNGHLAKPIDYDRLVDSLKFLNR